MENKPSTSSPSTEAKDINDVRKEKALEGLRQVLNLSDTYSRFCNDKLMQNALANREGKRLRNMMNQSTIDESIQEATKNLKYFKGTLRDYQIEGFIWLKTLYQNGVNGILADEMGLGKTIQVIALISHLYEMNISGPFLIVVPLSTLSNWQSEFERFAPDLPTVMFYGDKDARERLKHDLYKNFKLESKNVKPVVITTRHMLSKSLRLLNEIRWKCLVIDEAQVIKNYNTQVSQDMRTIHSSNKVLLTGTPLQNNLEELWSLLNFIMPMIFKNVDVFSSLFLLKDLQDDDKILKEEESTNVVSKVHRMLAPFMLRRLKSDVLNDLVPKKEVLVYCPLTKTQKKLYRYVLEKNIYALRGKLAEFDDIEPNQPRKKRKCTQNIDYSKFNLEEDFDDFLLRMSLESDPVKEELIKTSKELIKENGQNFVSKLSSLDNPMQMFKKISDHPYLVRIPVNEDKTDVDIDERLITESGKMMVMDALLAKLKADNHKVLIFSTYTMMLDLIEDYMILKNYSFSRLDGSRGIEDRSGNIEAFNNDPEVFAFLISTRAGGLGLNLTAADTVIFFDRDWNPQADIQAQDRCHRIGQTKPVLVYSLVSKNTIDETIVSQGHAKRRLEKIVMKDGKFKQAREQNYLVDLKELKEMLMKDNSEVVISKGNILSDEELESLMDRSDLLKKMEKDNPVVQNKISENKENQVVNI